MSLFTVTMTLMAFNSFTSWAFEVPQPKLREPPTIIVRQLNPEAKTCHQMTWDSTYTTFNPRICRGGPCFSPGIEGEGYRTFKACKLSKGESCIKVVKYDAAGEPNYVTRYCGNVKYSDGLLSSQCRKANNVEVCACRDHDGCNGADGLKSGLSFVASLLVIVLSKLL